MPRPKVSRIISRTNNPSNRITELLRRARQQHAYAEDEIGGTVASTIREALRVLDNDCGDNAGHTHPAGITESCPICWLMELCALELAALEAGVR